jgi:putative restriction endonuclease
MDSVLSITTVFHVPGRRVWYDDQLDVHRQFSAGADTVDYAFMGTNADARDNRLLGTAWQRRTPLIYFLGVAPGRYKAILPTFIVGIDRMALKAQLAFGTPDEPGLMPESSAERRYALRQVRQRLHQSSFREAVIWAYRERCAFSGLPEPRLLDAAHIVDDTHEELGQPIVKNGIALSKTYHAAFDAHLIGIDPDYRIHVSPRLLELRDGPTFEAMKRLDGQSLRRTRREQDLPDRNRLEVHYQHFRSEN